MQNHYKPPAEFNYYEAYILWEQGWCYKALSMKYGYCKDTIKKYVKKEAKNYKDTLRKHHKNHKNGCPICRDKNEQKKLF